MSTATESNSIIKNIVQKNTEHVNVDQKLRRTKIVATVGPACADPETFKQMMIAGLNVARLNFSHGTYESHEQAIKMMRGVAKELNKPLALLQDLQGPKIRIGKLKEGKPVKINAGDVLVISNDKKYLGDEKRVGNTYLNLALDAVVGNTILIDDGLLQFKVLSKKLVEEGKATIGDEIVCECLVGGFLSSNKGINLPGTPISAPALTEKDQQDLEFGLKQGVDYVALSFVRSAADVNDAIKLMQKHGRQVPIISKIERIEALTNYDEILQVSDGVMIARGDLGIELNFADLPILQKQLIAKSSFAGKTDITATQMLASMVENPVPTRAEVCDIANSIFDGTDAIMLSNESATGKYPVKAVEVMAEIAANADFHYSKLKRLADDPAVHSIEDTSVGEATCLAAVTVAAKYKEVKLICVVTESGKTADRASQYRPEQPIIALTPYEEVYNRLSLAWGVTPVIIPRIHDPEQIEKVATATLLETKYVKKGETYALVLGTKTVTGASNTVRIVRVQQE